MDFKLGSYQDAALLLGDPLSCLKALTITKRIMLMPQYLSNLQTGIKQSLLAETNVYSEAIDGVLVAYDNVRSIQSGGGMYHEAAQVHLDIVLDVIVFQPKVGCMLRGEVNKINLGVNIGCLVHKCFNASIFKPASVSTDEWEGSRLCLGDEFVFEVTKIFPSNGVLSMRGKLTEASLTVPKEMAVPETKAQVLDRVFGPSYGSRKYGGSPHSYSKKTKSVGQVSSSCADLNDSNQPSTSQILQNSPTTSQGSWVVSSTVDDWLNSSQFKHEPFSSGSEESSQQTKDKAKKKKKSKRSTGSDPATSQSTVPSDTLSVNDFDLREHKHKRRSHSGTKRKRHSVESETFSPAKKSKKHKHEQDSLESMS